MSFEKEALAAADRLSVAERRVATHLLQRPQDFAFLPVAEVALRIGVSTTTVIRTAQVLGYEGYTQLKAKARETIWPSRLTARFSVSETGSFKQIMNDDIEAIKGTMDHLDTSEVDRCVRILNEARRVFVVGQRMSTGPAEFFGSVLGTLTGKVQILGKQPGLVYDCLVGADSSDALVAIAFPRYVRSTVTLAQLASERGVKVISITDSPLSPIVPFSTHALYPVTNSSGPVDTYVAAVSLLNAIAGQVSLVSAESLSGRLRELDELLDRSGTYVTENNRSRGV